MGTGKFITVYPGIWTEREKPYAEEYFAKIKELEDRGPIDVQALISGKIEKGTQGFSNVLEVKEDMMVYNAKKYDPDNKLYTDDEYAKSLGFDGKIAMPAFAAHDDSFLTAFNGKARDFLAVTGLHHEIEQLLPVYAGDTLYLVKDKLELIDLTPKEYELLIYFKNNRAIALSRESILNAVWGYDYFGDLRTVDTHVKKLRAKLGECGTMIETVRGYGYRFEV